MSKNGKLAILVVALLVAAAGAAYVTQNRREQGVEVRIDTVSRRDLVASVAANGTIRPLTQVDVSAEITGQIVQLAVEEGQRVTEGQLLLRIDPAQFEAAVKRAEAALSSARAQEAQSAANAEQAVRDLQRSQEIHRSNAALVSDEQLERLATQVKVSTALAEASTHAVDQALAGVEDAESNLAKTVIRAPMSGTITSLNVKSGETAIVGTMNRAQGVLMSIGDLTGLMTVVTVGEADVSRIEVGDSAVVQMDAFIDTTFVGRVTQISSRSILGASAAAGSAPAVDYEVTIEILNAPRETRIDFSTSAKIVVEQRTQTLAVPIVALTVREHETIPDEDSVPALAASKAAREIGRVDVEGVFLIGEDNKVTFRPVKVGIAGERYFEVLQGLSGGERIVAGTYQAIRGLRDSMMVRPAENDTLKTKGG